MAVMLPIVVVLILADGPERIEFSRHIQPLLQKHCYACHGKEKQKSGLRLDKRADALRGGDSGPVIVPGKASESQLWKNISAQPRATVMPPKGPRLAEKEIALIKEWINQGALWPEDGSNQTAVWWSLVPPVARPAPSGSFWGRNWVDSFLMEKMRAKGLSPSPEASKLILLRRASFDLTGLPPTPDEVNSFLADSSPDAYERLVDRLLASPRYGERWARHWLDLVHYGDTHGYDKDKLRLNAWPYRDYVIRSFNADKPFGQFTREQIAGDSLYPNTPDAIEALGFIAAGPWDFIGHAEVPESKIDGQIARHLDRDDMVGNTMGTFLSLTVQCAQCHNHKFDPITQEDYYRVQAVFAALDRADRKYYPDPSITAKFGQLMAEKKKVDGEIAAIEANLPGREELKKLEARLVQLEKPAGAIKPEFGYHSAIEGKADVIKWVQVDLGSPSEFTSVALHPCHDDFNNIGPGFGFPVRFKIECCNDPDFKKGVTTLYDSTAADFPNPGLEQLIARKPAQARYIRVTATKGALRQNDFIFALAELRVLDAKGNNLAMGKPVSALDSIEAPVRWGKKNLTDGIWFEGDAGRKKEVEELRKQKRELTLKNLPPEVKTQLDQLTTQQQDVTASLKSLPPAQTVYIGTVHTGSGAFSGTGAKGGTPRPIHLLRRGNVLNPGKEVVPGAIEAMKHTQSRFDLPQGHAEGLRREALAGWITHPGNPLFHRSILNRVWRWHFGRGLVETPSDFGRMGKEPSHPELLDRLAVEFGRNGESLKWLHRLILTSAAYRQVATGDLEKEEKDRDNIFYWRMNRRKLEVEAVRDATLAIAGNLRQEMYGPAFQDFIIEKPEHSPHYQYHLFNPENPVAFRRSVYRFLVRSQQQPFMTTLDCADPSLQVDKRNETVSALQALALLNNGFMLVQAKGAGARLEKEFQTEERIHAAFLLTLGRPPRPEEVPPLADFARQHGMASLARVLFNLNEFAFTD